MGNKISYEGPKAEDIAHKIDVVEEKERIGLQNIFIRIQADWKQEKAKIISSKLLIQVILD